MNLVNGGMYMIADIEVQYDKIYRFCFFRVHDRETAEDITQEAFLRFLEHSQYHGRGADLQYLYTIAGNLCIDEMRRKKTVPLEDDWGTEEPEEEWMLQITLKKAISVLPQEDRELILLRYVNEVPLSVLSEIYHQSRFSISRRLKKILATLRSSIEPEVGK